MVASCHAFIVLAVPPIPQGAPVQAIPQADAAPQALPPGAVPVPVATTPTPAANCNVVSCVSDGAVPPPPPPKAMPTRAVPVVPVAPVHNTWKGLISAPGQIASSDVPGSKRGSSSSAWVGWGSRNWDEVAAAVSKSSGVASCSWTWGDSNWRASASEKA